MPNNPNSLSDFFHSLHDVANLVDITLVVLLPTWSNGHCGPVGIAKRLDRLFMAESMCDCMGHFHSWHYSTRASNHKLVILQLEFNSMKP